MAQGGTSELEVDLAICSWFNKCRGRPGVPAVVSGRIACYAVMVHHKTDPTRAHLRENGGISKRLWVGLSRNICDLILVQHVVARSESDWLCRLECNKQQLTVNIKDRLICRRVNTDTAMVRNRSSYRDFVAEQHTDLVINLTI